MKKLKIFICLLPLLAGYFSAPAETITVGSGSYTTTHPGTDEAGRNKVPRTAPQVSGNAVGKPIPTNDWWSNVLYSNFSNNVFAYPIGMGTLSDGLSLAYIPKGPMVGGFYPLKISVAGIQVDRVTVSDYTDWTVTMNWTSGEDSFEATAGLAMPFVYFTKQSAGKVEVTHGPHGSFVVKDNVLILKDGFNGASFAVYAPTGSSWEGSGDSYSSSLNGKDYWSVAMLPLNASDAEAAAERLKGYAFAFPVDTKAEYSYDVQNAIVHTNYTVTTEAKEGTTTDCLMGLLPHHWTHLSSTSPQPGDIVYPSVRGEIKMLAGNHFSTDLTFHGILPTLPFVETEGQNGFSASELNSLIDQVNNDNGLDPWTDSYNDGQLLNRLVQTARAAKESGDEAGFQTAFNLVKERVENWLSYEPGEVAFLFYYHKEWTTMFGYPAGHYQDELINDHHFHWAYFIAAAAFIEQYQPGWADDWGGMVDLLVRDAVAGRDDDMFPYLRNFSPYAGHCWANGMAALPQGNDQESTSESMQFNSALIHWAMVTGNTQLRDLGIYLYATEQSAIEEYWFDVNDRVYAANRQYGLVSRVFGNDYDNGTFWTADIAASYGIELYPIHGGSFYLDCNPEYTERIWNEITMYTGILSNAENPDLWHDIMWEYLAFFDPQQAISLYDSYPDRSVKFGVSPAQTYHWIHAMACLGRFEPGVTADYPVAAAFRRNGRMTYVAQNYGELPLTVTFSDGFELQVPPRTLATGQPEIVPGEVSIYMASPRNGATIALGDAVSVAADVYTAEEVREVRFYSNGSLIGTSTASPYSTTWTAEEAGEYSLSATVELTDGKTADAQSVKVTVKDPDSPEEEGGCVYESAEASQGSFTDGYRLVCSTNGSNVVVTAECMDGFDDLVAYVWDYTNGFSEMSMMQVADKKFSCTLAGRTSGSTLKFAVKFAYRGGMAVTQAFDYTVGDNCAASIGRPDYEAGEVKFFPNPAVSMLHVCMPGEATVSVWNSEGRLMFKRTGMADMDVEVADWRSGIYFIRVEGADGKSFVDKFIKK